MDTRIQASVELWRENGQWKMTLRAPDWVLRDLSRTMEAQTHPQVLVMASSMYRDGICEHIYFTTWGGGAIGGDPLGTGKKVIQLVEYPPVMEEK